MYLPMSNVPQLIIPSSLNPGDTIGLVAPSRKVSPEEVAATVTLLQEWGYRVLPGKNIYATENQFAGTDVQRASDINDMFANAAVKAILCVRGGYGCARLFEYLNLQIVAQNPKWLIGYSDITALHSCLNTFRVASVHGTMPINLKPEASQTETWQWLASLNTVMA